MHLLNTGEQVTETYVENINSFDQETKEYRQEINDYTTDLSRIIVETLFTPLRAVRRIIWLISKDKECKFCRETYQDTL